MAHPGGTEMATFEGKESGSAGMAHPGGAERSLQDEQLPKASAQAEVHAHEEAAVAAQALAGKRLQQAKVALAGAQLEASAEAEAHAHEEVAAAAQALAGKRLQHAEAALADAQREASAEAEARANEEAAAAAQALAGRRLQQAEVALAAAQLEASAEAEAHFHEEAERREAAAAERSVQDEQPPRRRRRRRANGPSKRLELVSEVFRLCDIDGDGWLSLMELRTFAEGMGFEGTAEEWVEAYIVLCSANNVDPDRGFSKTMFARMVNDFPDGGVFWTDGELSAMISDLKTKASAPLLAELRVEQLAAAG